ncbi:hypothetical protein D3C81_2098520 [compost metagenome]
MLSGRLLTSSGNMKKPSVPGPMLSTPDSVACADTHTLDSRATLAASRRGESARVGFIFLLVIIVSGRAAGHHAGRTLEISCQPPAGQGIGGHRADFCGQRVS